MFDPRDDARDRDEREEDRARVYDNRDRDDDPREGLIRDLDLPCGEEREMVAVRDRLYELNGEDTSMRRSGRTRASCTIRNARRWCDKQSRTWRQASTRSRK
jgi:hypothetical protein